jgi:hypothetical protein
MVHEIPDVIEIAVKPKRVRKINKKMNQLKLIALM